jgi:hypothetical protein
MPGKAQRRQQRRRDQREAQKHETDQWSARHPVLPSLVLRAPTTLDHSAAGWGTGMGWGHDSCNSL